ncbi:6-phosphogluconolactonase [Geranomyces variabilis]|nr:6-phosphogluconolactonase [Geranomyces variabilis]KAJ3138313.1 suppressor of los1-1 [Geranomyces variabilis]
MPATPEIFRFSSSDDISRALDHFIAETARAAIARSGRFTVSLSGGSLPKTLAKNLKDNKAIEWSKWHIFFADERCVALDHEDSNYLLAKQQLLDHVPIPATHVYTINPALVGDHKAAAKDYAEQIKKAFGGSDAMPSIDLNLLGIGPDGHCCSLFPGHRLLDVTDVWVAYLDDSPKPPPSRITLTYPIINNADINLFVVTGDGKADAIHKIVDQKEALPSGRVQAKRRLIWFLDDGAAGKLNASTLKYNL